MYSMGYSTNRPIIQIDNKELSSQMAETETELTNSTAHFEKHLIEKGGTVHSGGYTYTAFFSGAAISGKEVYIGRCGPSHATIEGSENKLITYIREDDGSFSTKILDIDYTQGDYRDPNITITPDGKSLILTSSSHDFATDTYKGWLWLLDSNLNVVGNPVPFAQADTNIFLWGNTLVTPSGKLIKTVYDTSLDGGVYLYRSTGGINNIGSFSRIATIAQPGFGHRYTEATIAYWGDKLVTIVRDNQGDASFSSTLNLEGDDGWLGAYLPFRFDSPVLEPYIKASEPIIACGGYYVGNIPTNYRLPAITSSVDGITWVDALLIDDGTDGLGGAGYTSLLKNRYGYGVIWMETYADARSNVWFKDVDAMRYIGNLGYKKYKLNTRSKNYCRVRNSFAQAVTKSGLTLNFDTTDYDSNNIHSTTDNTKLVSKSSGIYIISAGVVFTASAIEVQLSIIVNGIPIQLASVIEDAVQGLGLNVSTTYKLNIGDYVQVQAYQPSSGIISTVASGKYTPTFSLVKISDI